jgi:hypothetical protein
MKSLKVPVIPPIMRKANCPFCDRRLDRDLLFEHIKFDCKAPKRSEPNMSLDVEAQLEPRPQDNFRLDDNNTQYPCK